MTSTSAVSARPASYADIAVVLDELPEIIRHTRRLYGISHRTIADLTDGDVSYSSIYRLENRTGTVELTTAIAILRALDALTRTPIDRG